VEVEVVGGGRWISSFSCAGFLSFVPSCSLVIPDILETDWIFASCEPLDTTTEEENGFVSLICVVVVPDKRPVLGKKKRERDSSFSKTLISFPLHRQGFVRPPPLR